ncbi:HNH endonuclease signature motif containing protein [Nocardioides stalactiti]|uniref:HNH endonuclease signature motif containing protein n=1 Tax=Nocardioides stalactiti TaxID=2755356 RepID=UPI0016049FCE|nr:HNH endonuclease signature motif containing protein [Nocardioides stalactiti]
MVAQVVERQHPILACAQAIGAALADVADVQPTYMAPADQRAALLELTTVRRQLDELQLRVVAAAGPAVEAEGARDVAAWLVMKTQADGGSARAEQRLARAVDDKWLGVRNGLAAGEVSVDQARVIVAGLEALPAEVGPDVIAKAEAHLVALAGMHTPRELRVLARRILEIVAPEIAEAEEAKRLEREEQDARDKIRFSCRYPGDGTARGTLVLPDADMTRLVTYLESFASPRKTPGAIGGDEDRVPYHRRLGQAFCSLLEHLDPAHLPAHGGHGTTLMVTMTRESLLADLGVAAVVGGGERLSASAVRRLACTAKIIPVVLGGKGEILDLGRSRRLYSSAQHKAMRLRDQHCRAENCSIPATWCEAHHLKPWSQGGKTDIGDGALLCSWHHHVIHDRRYEHEVLRGGAIRIRRRAGGPQPSHESERIG